MSEFKDIRRILGECITHGYNDKTSGLAEPSEACKQFFKEKETELFGLLFTILDGLMMKEHPVGKHSGHAHNDDSGWCYVCDEYAPEGEFTQEEGYNRAVFRFNQQILILKENLKEIIMIRK